MEGFQISGPAWIDEERYDVVATIPEGAPKEEIPAMLQRLLADRFHMTLRFETREQNGYVLGIGKDGPKLKLSAKQDPRPSTDPDASGRPTSIRIHMQPTGSVEGLYGATMPAFAASLSIDLKAPVLDSTGLPGRFDIEGIPVGGPDSSAGPSLSTAIHDLGLTLTPHKLPLRFIVVEKTDKIPTLD